MTPRTKQQYEEIRADRKNLIMETALEVFAEDGYERSSVARIASRAGISKGLLYNYFDSKEDLLISILTHGIEQIHGILTNIEAELDTPEALRLFIRGGMELIRREPEFFKLYFTILFQKEVSEKIRSRYQEMAGPLFEDIAHYYKAKGDPKPFEKAFLLGAMLDGLAMHYLMAPENVDLDILEGIIFDLFK